MNLSILSLPVFNFCKCNCCLLKKYQFIFDLRLIQFVSDYKVYHKIKQDDIIKWTSKSTS